MPERSFSARVPSIHQPSAERARQVLERRAERAVMRFLLLARVEISRHNESIGIQSLSGVGDKLLDLLQAQALVAVAARRVLRLEVSVHHDHAARAVADGEALETLAGDAVELVETRAPGTGS